MLFLVFLFHYFVQGNGQVICFYKVAPMAIFFSATGIEIMVLDLLPCGCDLPGNRFNILWTNDDLFLLVDFPFVRLCKIEFSAYRLPASFSMIHEDFIKYSLPPVISSIRLLVIRWPQFELCLIWITSFVIYYIHSLAIKFKLVELSFYRHSVHHNVPYVSFNGNYFVPAVNILVVIIGKHFMSIFQSPAKLFPCKAF